MEREEIEKLALISFNSWKWEVRKRRAKDFIKSLPQKAKDIWDKDKELVLFLAPGVVYVVRRIAKMTDGRKEDFHRNCQIFDHSLGMWHDLRRPMTPKEKELFAKRKKAGESTLSILASMGLLKR